MDLSVDDGTKLIKLARGAIENHLARNDRISVSEEIARTYNQKAGVFVTLNSLNRGEEELRGCIGFPMPEKVLYEAMIDAAIASATGDPRFPPLKLEELDRTAIEISVLGKPELLTVNDPRQYAGKIRVGRDGLFIHWRYGSGLLLPQVAVECGWDEEEFLCQTCMKAGAMPDCWLYEDTRVYRFEAVVFKETAPNGDVVRVDLMRSREDSSRA